MADVYKGNLLDVWIQEILDDGAYPVKITIEINGKGEVKLSQPIDGRKKRAEFSRWMCKKFSETTNRFPPKNTGTKAFQKLWAGPLESMVRQAVLVGKVDYDSLVPKEKYSQLTGRTFLFALKDSYDAQQDAGLTLSDPNSLLKVALSTIADGNHYKRALVITNQ